MEIQRTASVKAFILFRRSIETEMSRLQHNGFRRARHRAAELATSDSSIKPTLSPSQLLRFEHLRDPNP